MRVASVNGKKYILVIVDDYLRFTRVKCLRSKDEAPDFIIKFLKMIQVRLKVPVRRIRIDNGTEFVNQTLREYYETIGISHETYIARSPQQNGVKQFLPHVTPKSVPSYVFITVLLFQLMFDELLTPPPSVDCPTPEFIAPNAKVVAPEPAVSTGSPSSTTVDQDAPSPSNSQTTPKTQSPVIPNDVEEDNHDLDVEHMNNDLFFGIPILENDSKAYSLNVIPTVMHTAAPNLEHVNK
ncbi:retrovirus-related pol polyprotein from transposon TNT 1-94 [Tanacetum coccineum]